VRNIICHNCGGEFNETEAKCPFCGMIYEPGAEAQYKENLEDLRSDLDIVDNIAEDSYKADLKLFFKTLLPILAVAAICGVIGLFAYHNATTGEKSQKRLEAEKAINEAVLAHQYIAEWDKLYEEGRYDELAERVSSEKSEISSSYNYWNYRDFADAYSYGVEAEKRLEYAKSVSKEKIEDYNAISVLQDVFEFKYYIERLEKRNHVTYDMDAIYTKYDQIKEEVIESLDMTEADYNVIKEKTIDGGYPSYTACKEAYHEIYGEE